MNRHFNPMPRFYRQVDDLSAGAPDFDNEEADVQPAAPVEPEEPAAPAVDPVALQQQLAEANARIERMEKAQQTATQAVKTDDPAVIRQQMIRAIADEFDEEKKEELRLQLYTFESDLRYGADLSHSRAQGATAAVLRLAESVDEAARPFIEEVVQQHNVNIKTLDPIAAQNVADIAYMRAQRAGKITAPAPAPAAPRTPVSAAAPTASTAKAPTFEGGLARDEQEHLTRYIAEYTPPGVDPAKAWDEKKKATIVREYREAKEYRASLS